MSISHPYPHDCSASPRLQDGSCATCVSLRRPAGTSFTPVVIPAKTVGIAVLLSILWLGAGHLYANKIGTGIALIALDAVLCCVALTGVGMVVAVPVWLVLAPIVAALSASAVRAHNIRNGLASY